MSMLCLKFDCCKSHPSNLVVACEATFIDEVVDGMEASRTERVERRLFIHGGLS